MDDRGRLWISERRLRFLEESCSQRRFQLALNNGCLLVQGFNLRSRLSPLRPGSCLPSPVAAVVVIPLHVILQGEKNDDEHFKFLFFKGNLLGLSQQFLVSEA